MTKHTTCLVMVGVLAAACLGCASVERGMPAEQAKSVHEAETAHVSYQVVDQGEKARIADEIERIRDQYAEDVKLGKLERKK